MRGFPSGVSLAKDMRTPATFPGHVDLGRPLRRRPSLLALALAGAGAVAGATMLLGSTTETRQPSVPLVSPTVGSSGPAEVGDRVTTAFGSMSLDAAMRLVGPTGTGLTLQRGEIPLQVSVTFVNTSKRPVADAPSLLRLVPAAGGPAIEPGAGDLATAPLDARSAKRYVLRYAIPAQGALPQLQFSDRGERTTFSLGDRGSLPGFDHGRHSPGPDGGPYR
jgi:hypothetical protein